MFNINQEFTRINTIDKTRTLFKYKTQLKVIFLNWKQNAVKERLKTIFYVCKDLKRQTLKFEEDAKITIKTTKIQELELDIYMYKVKTFYVISNCNDLDIYISCKKRNT